MSMSTYFHHPSNIKINAGCTDRVKKYYVLTFDDDSGNDVKVFFDDVENLRIMRDSVVGDVDAILREEENAVSK